MSDCETIEARINKLEIELASIKEKVSFYGVIYEKFDSTLEKVQKLMEDRRSDVNDDLKDVYTKISDTEKKLLDEMTKMREEMQKHHQEENDKIDDLNKWRWIVLGAATVVGWIFGKLFTNN